MYSWTIDSRATMNQLLNYFVLNATAKSRFPISIKKRSFLKVFSVLIGLSWNLVYSDKVSYFSVVKPITLGLFKSKLIAFNLLHEVFELMTLFKLASDLIKFKLGTKAAVRRYSVKMVFLQISQNSQKNSCVRALGLQLY